MPATHLSLQRSIKPSFQNGGVCTSSWDASLKKVEWDGRKTSFMIDIYIYTHTCLCIYIYICILGNTPRISPMKMAFLVKPIENCVNDLVTVTWNRLCLNVSFIFGPSPPLKLTDFACQLAGVHSKFPRRPQHISYPSDITMAKIFAF